MPRMYGYLGNHVDVQDFAVPTMLDRGFSLTPPKETTYDIHTQRLAQGIEEMDRKAKEDDIYRDAYFTQTTGLPDLKKLQEETQLLYPDEEIPPVTAADRQRALASMSK